jgi:hypothetical protein
MLRKKAERLINNLIYKPYPTCYTTFSPTPSGEGYMTFLDILNGHSSPFRKGLAYCPNCQRVLTEYKVIPQRDGSVIIICPICEEEIPPQYVKERD